MDKKTGRLDALVVDQQAAAELLGISVSTLRRWRRDGKGPRAIRISRLIRYRPRDLTRFVAVCESRSLTHRGLLRRDAESAQASQAAAATKERHEARRGIRV